MKYTLIEAPDKTDIHRFKLEDGSATIEIVNTPYRTYYNVYKWNILDGQELTHKDFIIKYYDMNDGSDFGILVYRAQDMYLELMDE